MQNALTRARIYIFFDLLLLTLALYGLWWIGSLPSTITSSLPEIALTSALMFLTALVMGLYRPHAVTEPRFQARCLVAIVACIFIVGSVSALFSGRGISKEHLVAALTLCLVGMMALRVGMHRLSLRSNISREILAVLPESGMSVLRKLTETGRTRVESFPVDMDPSKKLADCARHALLDALRTRRPTDVVLSDGLQLDPALAMELAEPQRRGLRVTSLSRFMAEEFGRMPHDDPETLRELVLRSRPRSWAALFPKRVMDVTLSLVLLILLLPVMAMAAFVVRLGDGGPVLYRQTRVGLDQRPFTLLKFRSMRVDAEANGVARWAERKDSRITRFGALMRLTRIDELPQLLNVLRGDMSLVGPRPERPEMIAQLKEHIPAYDFRHLVPPGLTGWAQINYPYGASVEDAIQKTNYDLYYVTHRSCIRDALILLETIRVVLFAEGSR